MQLFYKDSFHSSYVISQTHCPSLSSLWNRNIPYNTKPPSISAKVTPYSTVSFDVQQLVCSDEQSSGWKMRSHRATYPTNLYFLYCFQTLVVTKGSAVLHSYDCNVMYARYFWNLTGSGQLCATVALHLFYCWALLCKHNHRQESPSGNDWTHSVPVWETGYHRKTENHAFKMN